MVRPLFSAMAGSSSTTTLMGVSPVSVARSTWESAANAGTEQLATQPTTSHANGVFILWSILPEA